MSNELTKLQVLERQVLSYDKEEETWCACVGDVSLFEEYSTAEAALGAVESRASKYAPVLRELARIGGTDGKAE